MGNQSRVEVNLPISVKHDSVSKIQLSKRYVKESPDSLAEYINENNETGAYIFILENNGSIKIMTNKFYLTNMQIAFKERAQLLDTFESENIIFFGDSLKIYSFSGFALDYASTEKNKHYFYQSMLMNLYNNALRGTLLIKNKQIAVLRVLNHLIYGYPLDFNVVYDANLDKASQFRMSWVIVKHTLSFPGIIEQSELDINSNLKYSASSLYSVFDQVIQYIENFIFIKNWRNENSDFNILLDNLYKYFKVFELNQLTISDLKIMVKSYPDLYNNFREKFNEKVQELIENLDTFLKVIDQYPNVIGMELLKTDINNILDKEKTILPQLDPNNFETIAFSHFSNFMTKIINLRETAIIYKIKYI